MRRDPGPQKRRHLNLAIVTREEFSFRSERSKLRRAITTRDQVRGNVLTFGDRKFAVKIFFQTFQTNFTLHNQLRRKNRSSSASLLARDANRF